MKNKKDSFIKKAFCSIFKVETYPAMAAEGFQRACTYLFAIVFIFSVTCAIYNAVTFGNIINEVKQYILNESPDISYEKGMLNFNTESAYEFNNNKLNTTVIINTNEVSKEEIESYSNKLNNSEIGILLLNDRIKLQSPIVSKEGNEIIYKDIVGIEKFEKQDIVNHLQMNKNKYIIAIVLTTLIGSILIYAIVNIINILVVSLSGIIASRFVGIKMRYVAVFNMSVYAITLSSLLELVYLILNMFTTFKIEYFDVMYMGVATIYLITAMLMLKIDHIQHQKELVEILEVQKQVKKEMEDAKEEKDEKQEKKEKQKKEENPKENKEDEEGVCNE